MGRHHAVDKEAGYKTFISPCASFPTAWDFKTAKELQNQTAEPRTSSPNQSPAPFAQLHLPGMDTWAWPHRPLIVDDLLCLLPTGQAGVVPSIKEWNK